MSVDRARRLCLPLPRMRAEHPPDRASLGKPCCRANSATPIPRQCRRWSCTARATEMGRRHRCGPGNPDAQIGANITAASISITPAAFGAPP